MDMTPQEKVALAAARKWNNEHPVGAPVFYWTGLKKGPGRRSRTRAKADVRGGTAVVWVDFHAACIALTHIEYREHMGIGAKPFSKSQRRAFWELIERYDQGSTFGENDFRRYEATVQQLETKIRKLTGKLKEAERTSKEAMEDFRKAAKRVEDLIKVIDEAIDLSDNDGGSASDAIQDMLDVLWKGLGKDAITEETR